mmetsp:Transcript_79772/g.159288  ORF Transcript_79772/g.159288 Transcript_79772/m.159288 type:complete len:228 (-) Transcript_79772:182-865(-)
MEPRLKNESCWLVAAASFSVVTSGSFFAEATCPFRATLKPKESPKEERPNEKRLSRLLGGGTFSHASFSFGLFLPVPILPVSATLFTGLENLEGFGLGGGGFVSSSPLPNDIRKLLPQAADFSFFGLAGARSAGGAAGIGTVCDVALPHSLGAFSFEGALSPHSLCSRGFAPKKLSLSPHSLCCFSFLDSSSQADCCFVFAGASQSDSCFFFSASSFHSLCCFPFES